MTSTSTYGVVSLSAREMIEFNGGHPPDLTTSFAHDITYWCVQAGTFYWGMARGFFGG